MSLRIGTNVASLAAQRQVGKAQRATETALKRLSSGQRAVGAGSDAATFSMGERLRADIAGLKKARQNGESAISIAQVAEGGLNEQFNIAVRLRELAVQSASDVVSDNERGYLEQEFQQLVSEFDRIAKTTEIGGNNLLSSSDSKEFEILMGASGKAEESIKFSVGADTTAAALGLDGFSVESKDDSRDVLVDLDDALEELTSVRATYASVQSRFYHAIDHLDSQIETTTEAKSRMLDTDIAAETANLAQAQIIQESAIGVLAQANMAPKSALRLIAGI